MGKNLPPSSQRAFYALAACFRRGTSAKSGVMLKAALSGIAFAALATGASFGQGSGYQSVPVELANLREDVRVLSQRVGELQLRLEQAERENNELRAKTSSSAQNNASVQQL